jgi:hypothetical protein
MQPYENVTDYSTHFANMFATPKHFPCDDLEDHKLRANEEQNRSKPSVSTQVEVCFIR